jgi:hypothetical protein
MTFGSLAAGWLLKSYSEPYYHVYQFDFAQRSFQNFRNHQKVLKINVCQMAALG